MAPPARDTRPFRAEAPPRVVLDRIYNTPALLIGWRLDDQGRDAEAVIITMTHGRQPYEITAPPMAQATPVITEEHVDGT